jgi:hypothetical protein
MNAYEVPGARFTLIAAADVEPNRFVKVNTDGCAEYATAADQPIVGVAYTEAKTGQPLSIADGVLMVEAAAAITAGDFVTAGAEGKAAKGDSGFVALTTATAGSLVTVKVN